MSGPSTRRNRLPTCFMHVPKCAGSSVHVALEAALGPGSIAPRRYDGSVFADLEDFALLPEEARALIALEDEEVRALASYRAVSGHFSLATLLAVTDPASIGTVLREPRARLLSLYAYWRVPGIGDFWEPHHTFDHASRPLSEFLAEPRLAAAIDNQICRMLLHEDPRLPRWGFASRAEVESIAADAFERLRTLGFVGLIELDAAAWHGLGQLFGVTLDPRKANVTEEFEGPLATQPGEDLLTDRAFELIDERSAADRLLYDHALALAGVAAEERVRIAGHAFAQQLVKLGNLLGGTAARLTGILELERERERTIERLHAEANDRAGDLVRLQGALDAVHASASWRLTTPLRSAKRHTHRLLPSRRGAAAGSGEPTRS